MTTTHFQKDLTPQEPVINKFKRAKGIYSSLSTLTLCVMALLSGCALTPMEVNKHYETKSSAIESARAQAATQRTSESAYSIVKGNYLGGSVIATSVGTSLPQKYRDVSHSSAMAMGTLQVAVRNIQNLGLNVRINPDVTAPKAESAPSATPPVIGLQGQIPSPAATQIPSLSPFSTGAQAQSPVLVPLSFKGDLGDYLNQIVSQLGASWEYNPAANEVHLFRMVTRSCNVMDVPGSIMFADNMSGGGSSSSGTTGGSTGGGQGNSGTFGSSSSSSVNATYNGWDALITAINTVVTPAAKVAANQATGTVVISDTKEGVERACNLIASENARMNLQVAIDVREITVQLNDGNSVGFDLNLVYQQLNAITGSPDWVFKYNSPSNLTDGGSGSVGFNVARPASRLAGSAIAAQALASFGKIVSDKTDTILTRNRVPGRFQRVTEQSYLASTTPAMGNATGGGAGVPGLTPGVVTYGSTITLIPTVGDSNQVVLHLFDTQSDLLAINSVSTGAGLTLQQINTPILSRRKFAQSFSVQHGETLIIVGSESETVSSNTNAALTGASSNAKRIKGMSVLMVTPRIMTGS